VKSFLRSVFTNWFLNQEPNGLLAMQVSQHSMIGLITYEVATIALTKILLFCWEVLGSWCIVAISMVMCGSRVIILSCSKCKVSQAWWAMQWHSEYLAILSWNYTIWLRGYANCKLCFSIILTLHQSQQIKHPIVTMCYLTTSLYYHNNWLNNLVGFFIWQILF
jgi:hypothetical protein